MLWQRSAKWPDRREPLYGRDRLRLFDYGSNQEIFNLKLKLLDLAEHLLALPAEEHLLQLLDYQHPLRQRLRHRRHDAFMEETHVLSPRLVNMARIGYNHSILLSTVLGAGSQPYYQQFGLNNLSPQQQ